MSNFTQFMKKNKVVKPNVFYAPTKSLCDENGEPLQWEFRAPTTEQNDTLRDGCMREVAIRGKAGQYRQKLDSSLYLARLICASVVYPELNNAELQDSYGVKTPESLLQAMVDEPGEYSNLALFVQELGGFTESLDDKVDEAKN